MVDSGGSLDGKKTGQLATSSECPELQCVYYLITDVLCEYFYSWRPYKTILVRLRQFHGIRRRLVAIAIHHVTNNSAQPSLAKIPIREIGTASSK